jgi:very-short-patch-repair endonuclease
MRHSDRQIKRPPAEEKLWKHLRAHRIGNVHFRASPGRFVIY